MDHFIGVDLGKLVDPTALCVLARSLAIDKMTGLPMRGSKGDAVYSWECRAIKRYPLGTSYLAIVSDVVRICRRQELQPGLRLCLDATGVGVAVTELFARALVNDPVELHSISITSGESFTAVDKLVRNNLVARGVWRVAKSQLIGTIRAVLEGRRFKISPDPDTGKPLELATVLIRELQNFRETITASANMVYEARQGLHDDVVLAACLPIWLGSQVFCSMHTASTIGGNARFKPSEVNALEASRAAVERRALRPRARTVRPQSTPRERSNPPAARHGKRTHACIMMIFGIMAVCPHTIASPTSSSRPTSPESSTPDWSIWAAVDVIFKAASGEPVERRGGVVCECFGHPAFSRRIITNGGLGEIVAEFDSLEQI